MTITVRGLKPGTAVYLRAPEWSDKTSALPMSGEAATELAVGKYTPVLIYSEYNTIIKVSFDMTPKVIPFGGEFKELPMTDYHVHRWIDPRAGVCDRTSMVKGPMCTVQVGPLVLARSKKIGSAEEDMFSGKTVFGKDVKCTARHIRRNNLLALCRVSIDADGEACEYLMCDYASAANCDTFDPKYFTVFV